MNRMAVTSGREGPLALSRLFSRLQRLWAGTVVGATIIGVASLYPLIEAWLGGRHGLAAELGAFLVIGYGLNILTGPTIAYLRALGRPGLEARLGFVTMGLNLLLSVVLGLAFGAVGVVLSHDDRVCPHCDAHGPSGDSRRRPESLCASSSPGRSRPRSSPDCCRVYGASSCSGCSAACSAFVPVVLGNVDGVRALRRIRGASRANPRGSSVPRGPSWRLGVHLDTAIVISVIVVNYRKRDLVDRCLEAVETSLLPRTWVRRADRYRQRLRRWLCGSGVGSASRGKARCARRQ